MSEPLRIVCKLCGNSGPLLRPPGDASRVADPPDFVVAMDGKRIVAIRCMRCDAQLRLDGLSAGITRWKKNAYTRKPVHLDAVPQQVPDTR
jgi:hypothetical protein